MNESLCHSWEENILEWQAPPRPRYPQLSQHLTSGVKLEPLRFRFLWPCTVNIRWRERSNKMQLISCILLVLSLHLELLSKNTHHATSEYLRITGTMPPLHLYISEIIYRCTNKLHKFSLSAFYSSSSIIHLKITTDPNCTLLLFCSSKSTKKRGNGSLLTLCLTFMMFLHRI